MRVQHDPGALNNQMDVAPTPHELFKLAEQVALDMEMTRARAAQHTVSIDLAFDLFPETRIELRSFSTSSALDPAVREICDAIRALGPKIEACHLDTLRSLPFTAHTLDVYLSVGKHRKIEHLTVSEESPWRYGSPLGPCLAQAMRKLKFARSMELEGEIHLWIHFAAPGSQ